MWSVSGSVHVLINSIGKKIAGFDLDSTLVVPKSGNKFATSRTDWVWWNEKVPDVLRSLHASGYSVVIFSNQSGVAKGTTKIEDVNGKITDMAKELGFPLNALIACEHDRYRKPSTGMWEYLISSSLDDVVYTQSFYCGDAAGREKGWNGNKKTPKDFACSDRMFAANIGIRFLTPEEFFLGHPCSDRWSWGSVDPRSILSMPKQSPIEIKKFDRELVLMVGCPASGKTTLSKSLFPDYVRVCNDELGSKKKSFSVAAKALSGGVSVVVDNTNPSSDVRKEWIDLAKSVGVSVIRCVHVTTARDIAQHMNCFRELTSDRKRVPDIVYNIYFSHFRQPVIDEGFHEVISIPFSPAAIDKKDEVLFLQWTC